MSEYFKTFEEMFYEGIPKLRTMDFGPTLPSWPRWNQVIGGMQANQYTILCGPTGAGKTTFLANISAQLMVQNVPHYVMSVETGPHDYMVRVMGALSGGDIRETEPVSEKVIADWTVKYAHLAIRPMNLGLHETRMDLERMKTEILDQVKRFGTKVVFIDNLNFLLEVKRAADTLVEMDRVTHDLIEFVKSCPVHVVMVMHPKKTDGGRIVSEFDIKGSSTAVQEAHNVILFNRPVPEHIKSGDADRTDREIMFAKLRKRGRYQGCSLYFRCVESVLYEEKGMSRP